MRKIALVIILLTTPACDNAVPPRANVEPPPAAPVNLANADGNRAAAPPTELVWEDRPFPRPRRVSNLDVTLKSGKVLDRRLHYYCEVHGGELREELAPLYFGHPGYGNTEENRARAALFPWAVWHHNECNVDHHEQALITYCEMCRLVEPTWRADALRTAKRRHVRYAIEGLKLLPSKPGETWAKWQGVLVAPPDRPKPPPKKENTLLDVDSTADIGGAAQTYVRRLGPDPSLNFPIRQEHADGPRYAAGGVLVSYTYPTTPTTRFPFEWSITISNLPPGEYLFYLEYTFSESKIAMLPKPVAFTIRDDGTLVPAEPVKKEPAK